MGHIHLIGFMCCGKSTVGRLLAPLLGLPFADTDRLVEARTGPLLPYVRDHGEEAFRRVEAEVLRDLLGMPRTVVATGGGTPLATGHMELLRESGTVVWLDVPLDVLMPRIVRAGGDRPLLFGLHGEALQQRVSTLLHARQGTYAGAHLRVDATGGAEEVALRVRDALGAQAM